MSDLKTSPDPIKLPYPTEGVIRTANIDDTVAPENSVQLAVNMNFDRVGAVKTREGVTSYADVLVDGINNYGTLYNSYPDGYERIVQQGPIDSFTSNFVDFLSSAKIDDTHIIMFWAGTNVHGFAQVFEIGKDGGLTPLGTPLEFDAVGASWNKCIKVDDTHFLNVWEGASLHGWAQVFTFDPVTYQVSDIGSPYDFEASEATRFSLAQVDADHYICFYTGNSDTDAMATILGLTAYAVGEPGTTFTFDPGNGGQNNCTAVGDDRFINTWNGLSRVFDVDTGTWAISFSNASGASVSVQALVVAGGGAGGGSNGGGGGAGGYQYNASLSLGIQSYAVTIGNGGTGSAGNGTNGGNSSFSTITSIGGGGGGDASHNGANGGCGGGGGQNAGTTGGTGNQGGNGGGGSAAPNAGGGGGAGGNGGTGGGGGAGASGGGGTANSISGASVTYAGGGGGRGASSAGTGGAGGGGSATQSGTGVAGTDGLGGGGGGGSTNGGAGGKGIVIISVPENTITAFGGVKTNSGGRDIWTFTSNDTFIITAIGSSGDNFEFDAAGSTYNTVLPIGDGEHFIVFWKSGSGGVGKAQVLDMNISTFNLSAIGTPLQFATDATQNAAVALGDGEHFVNYWATYAGGDGYTQLFNVNPSTFAVTAVASPYTIKNVYYFHVSMTSVLMTPYRTFAFWVSSDTSVATGFGEMFRYTGALVDALLYAESGDEVYNTPDTTWTSRRSGLSQVSKARFSQFLGYIWMVNGNETIGGDPIATSSGGDFGTDLVPVDFPPGDFIQGGFEGRVWVFDKTMGIIHYTDIVQFTPPGSYSLTYDPEVNFISTISPQTGQQFTAVKQVPRALLVFTEDNIWRIYGATSIDAYPAYNVGTYSQESIVETKTGIFFHHSSGFYQFDYGSQPVEISRRVIDFVKAIPRSYYDNITGVFDGFDAIEWSVGQVLVEGVIFANCVMRYTISTQTWTIYDYNLISSGSAISPNSITAMISYDDGEVLNHLMGTSDVSGGFTGAMDTGTTDFGRSFYFEYIDRWRGFTNSYAFEKTITGMNVYSENAAGANLMYQVQKSGPNAWQTLGTITEANNSLLPNAQTDDFDVLRFRIAGNTSGTQVVIHGIEILNLTVKGFDQN